jgi:hypothetical protein
MPRLKWRGQRPLGFLVVAIAYVALAFLLPARGLALYETPLDITRPAERLSEQVRVLKEEKIIDTKRAEDLNQKIEDLRSQSTGKDPAKTLEAMDHLNDVVRQAAKQDAESKARQANQLGKVQAAAEALQKAAPKLTPKEMAELMKELNALAQKAAKESEAFQQELSPDLAAALNENKLTPEQLKELADAAKNGRDTIAKSARKLADAKLIDPDQLKACEGGKRDSDALAKYLADKKGKDGKGKDGKGKDGMGEDGQDGKDGKPMYGKSLEEGLGEMPGKGGVTEGPGAAAIDFGDRSTSDSKFKEEALPPSEVASLKQSQLSGVGKAPPKIDPATGTPQAGGLTNAAVGGGSANTAPVLPQHRGAIDRYFDRPMK